MRNQHRIYFLILTLIAVVFFITSCGSPKEIQGYYETDNLGLIFSGFKFSDNGKVAYYCGGFENAHGTYKPSGNGYKLTIEDFDSNSNFTADIKEIKESCDIKVTPKDDKTIGVNIECKDSDYIFVGQKGEEEYHKKDE